MMMANRMRTAGSVFGSLLSKQQSTLYKQSAIRAASSLSVTSSSSTASSHIFGFDNTNVITLNNNTTHSFLQQHPAISTPSSIAWSNILNNTYNNPDLNQINKAIVDPTSSTLSDNAMHMTSVLRKRRIKMRKHKYQKLRKRTKALRKKLGK